MKRGKKVDFWFPLYVDKWLWGSTRHELDHSERAIFTDLMALATKDDGYVRANETTPYPHPQLAGILCCSIDLLESTIEKCIKFGKIEDKGSGIYYVCNWKEYSLSVRWIREVDKSKKECSEKREVASENLADSGKPYSIVYSSILSSISFNLKEGYGGITEADIEAWAAAYPACDVRTEILKSAEWLKANPDKKKKNYRRFIVNWLGSAQERGGSKPSNRPRFNEPEGSAAWYARTHGEKK